MDTSATQMPIPVARKVIEFLVAHGQKLSAQHFAHSIAQIYPKDPTALALASETFRETKDFLTATHFAQSTYQLMPEDPQTQLQFCRLLNAVCYADEAEKVLSIALQKNPHWTEGILELSNCLGLQGKIEQAYGILRSLLQNQPDHPLLQFRTAWYEMNRGDLRLGMKYNSRGREVQAWGGYSMNFSQPKWQGEDPKGQTLLFFGEGGIGDQFLSVRFARTLSERGAKVIVACHPELISIFKRLPFVEDAITHNESLGKNFDKWVPGLEACALLDFDYSTLPNTPYLTTSVDADHKWNEIFKNSPKGKLKVGIRWQGHREFESEQQRRVPGELMFAWRNIPGIQLYSLQKPHDEPFKLPSEIIDMEPELKTWEDTLSAIKHLDIVITTCSSVGHAAGSMGKETWLMTPALPYFSWAEPGDRTSWYPSVRLFRQKRYRHWEEPCEEVATTLAALPKRL